MFRSRFVPDPRKIGKEHHQARPAFVMPDGKKVRRVEMHAAKGTVFNESNARRREMREHLERLFRLHVEQTPGDTVFQRAAGRERARALARTYFLDTAMNRMNQRDRDEQLLLMGDVIGRLFECTDAKEAGLFLAREWYW